MEVYCQFKHTIFTFDHKGGYTCRISNIVFVDSPNLIKIIGDHEEGKHDYHVVGLKIDNQKHIDHFPRGFGRKFPNLQYIEIQRCSLKHIRKEDLLDLGNLRGLFLQENLLVSLPNDVFSNVQGIRYLCLHKNHLKYIGKDVLNPLKNLEAANFQDNTCININYNKSKDPSMLQQLMDEIAQKCQYPNISVAIPDPTEFEDRIRTLETEVKTLKTQNQILSAKVSLIAPLETEVAKFKAENRDMQTRLCLLETLLH